MSEALSMIIDLGQLRALLDADRPMQMNRLAQNLTRLKWAEDAKELGVSWPETPQQVESETAEENSLLLDTRAAQGAWCDNFDRTIAAESIRDRLKGGAGGGAAQSGPMHGGGQFEMIEGGRRA